MGAALLGIRAAAWVFIAAAAAGVAGALIWEQGFGAPGGVDGLIVGVFSNLSLLVAGYRLQHKFRQ